MEQLASPLLLTCILDSITDAGSGASGSDSRKIVLNFVLFERPSNL